jgi:hypothetical protein
LLCNPAPEHLLTLRIPPGERGAWIMTDAGIFGRLIVDQRFQSPGWSPHNSSPTQTWTGNCCDVESSLLADPDSRTLAILQHPPPPPAPLPLPVLNLDNMSSPGLTRALETSQSFQISEIHWLLLSRPLRAIDSSWKHCTSLNLI